MKLNHLKCDTIYMTFSLITCVQFEKILALNKENGLMYVYTTSEQTYIKTTGCIKQNGTCFCQFRKICSYIGDKICIKYWMPASFAKIKCLVFL